MRSSPLCSILYHMLCIFSGRTTKDPLKDGEKKVVLVLLNFFHLHLFTQLLQMWKIFWD